MEYLVVLSPIAKSQIDDIVKYISITKKSPYTAAVYAKRLETEISYLGSLPKRNPLTDMEPWRSNGYRRMVYKNLLVYYCAKDEEKVVSVEYVINARRNQIDALGDTEGLDSPKD
ncbi:MAG: type II toxin-antitoxin system RelE/ParE family toxin [Clostridia bacterium]|nr:type II toxin-antitoxin system RelE/ParE family toxin [Clostridia bacterium]